MASLERKVAQRRTAAARRATAQKAAAVGRTGQVSRSTLAVGDEDVPLDEVLVGAVDTALTTADQETDLSYLNEGMSDDLDVIVDAGFAADGEEMIDVQDAVPDLGDEFDANADTDEAAHTADMTAIEAAQEVETAKADALAAAQAAANAQTTANGKNARRRGMTEPEPPEGGWTQGDQWVRDNAEGIPVELLVWNGASFVPDQILADEILVVDEAGVVRIGEGKVTAEALAVDAIDYKTAHGVQMYSGYIEAPHIASSSELGSGANVLADPDFQSTIDTAWVASGHLGDAATSSTDTHTWDQTVTRKAFLSYPAATLRYRGSGVSRLSLTPAVRQTGSLLFANYGWKPANRTFTNPKTYANPQEFYDVVPVGQHADEWRASVAPALGSAVSRTTYLTNSAVAAVQAGESWNVRVGFSRISADATALVALRVELINASTSAVVWYYDVSNAEKIAGAINTWFHPAANANLKLRIRAVYTAAGGSAMRRMDVGGYSRVHVDGVQGTNWVASTADNYHAYGSTPLGPPSGGGAAGAAGIPPANIKLRAELQVIMTSAVLAKVQPQKGWRLTEDGGLELFNSIGAKTGNVDGENNFLAGRFATAESGMRWEVQGERVVFFDASNTEVGGLRRTAAGIEIFGPVRYEGDTDWATISLTNSWGGDLQAKVKGGVVFFQGSISKASFSGNYEVAGTLPAAIPNPTTAKIFSYVVGSGSASILCNMQVNATGNILVRRTSATSLVVDMGCISYPT